MKKFVDDKCGKFQTVQFYTYSMPTLWMNPQLLHRDAPWLGRNATCWNENEQLLALSRSESSMGLTTVLGNSSHWQCVPACAVRTVPASDSSQLGVRLLLRDSAGPAGAAQGAAHRRGCKGPCFGASPLWNATSEIQTRSLLLSLLLGQWVYLLVGKNPLQLLCFLALFFSLSALVVNTV